jgi:tRNA-2-methylthio-N6-dimethylallyladenosine synthase
MNRVHIKTYGCQMNERDSEAVAAMLRARGYRIVGDEDACDILLLNTCAVRDAAEQKAIGKAGYLLARKRRQPDFILGILGCMAQNRGAALLDQLPDVDLIVGTQKFHQVPGHLDNLRAARAAGVPVGRGLVDIDEEEGSQNTIRDHLPPETEDEARVTAFVSIQQGCNMACTFCIVPRTRGDERSRPMDEIVSECEALAERGVREITLLGQIVTSYGRHQHAHRDGRSPFVQLLDRVHAIEGIRRIRFTSPHPRGFKDDLVEAYGRLPKLCGYAHLPLQSGSNRILRAMNRPYSQERYREIVAALRAVRPDMTFSTDVIVGFPGETEEDFAQTREVFEACDFDMAYIFKYSVRTGTPAAEMGDGVAEEVKEARNQILLETLRNNSLRRTAALVGTVEEVLVEGRDRTGRRFTGRTRGNRVTVFDADPSVVGEVVPVRIDRATVSTLYGERVLAAVEAGV